MRIYRKTIAWVLVVFVSLSCTPRASAIIPSEDTLGTFSVTETEPILGQNFILEQVEVVLKGQVINIKRTTYSNNQMVVEITENGITKRSTYPCDYHSARYALEHNTATVSEISTLERYAGYDYELLKIDTKTYYYTPKSMNYYDIFNDLSAAFCSVGWLKAATISTIAAIIAANSYAEVETKIVVTEYWYLETTSGQFVSYLCEYVATTYVQNASGGWDYAGVTSGDYNTLSM